MTGWPGILGGIALQALLLGLATTIAIRAGCAMLPASADLLERLGVAGMVAVTGWVGLLQVLGLLGVLWLPVVIGCLAVLAAVSIRFLPAPTRLLPKAARVPWGLVAAAVPFCVLFLTVTFLAPPTLDDSVRYHIVNAAHILNAGSIRGLPFAQPGDGSAATPGNGSLLLLVVMLPFHNAGLTGAVNLLFVGLIVACTAMLLRELGRGAWVGALAALMVVSTWGFVGWQIGSAYDDAIGLFGLLAGITCGLRAARTGEIRWLVLGGAGIGLAVGTKDVCILPAAAVAVAVVCLDRTWRDPRKVTVFIVGILGLSLAWYLRNWVDAGNPLFPETVRLGSTVIFPGLAAGASTAPGVDQSVLGWLLSGRGVPAAQWLGVAFAELGLTVLAVCSSLALVAWARGRARVVAVLSIACAVAFMVTPFTGSVERAQVVGSMRYLLPSIAFGVVGLAAVLPLRWVNLLATVALSVNVLALIIKLGTLAVAVLGVSFALSLVALAAPRWRRGLASVAWHPRARRLAAGLIVSLAVVASVHLQPSDASTPVQRALTAARNQRAPVVVMDVMDVEAILGSDLDVNIVAAGDGPVGAETPILDPKQLTARIESLHPAAVVIGDQSDFGVVPPGWVPPKSWRQLGA